MAYTTKYSKKFQRIGDTATYRVDILSEAGGAVVVPDRMGADPLQVKTLSAERDDTKTVIGSQCTFEFVLIKRTNEALYAPLFESEYRDHIVQYYNHDTSTLLWQGYLQPENIAKGIFDNNLHIYLSATDALKDLAEFRFLDSGSIVTGRKTALQILKLCLTNLGSQFQYNFIVKLGTKHTGMGVNDNALHLTTYDTRRFANVVDGNTEIDNCLEVIEKVLMPFNCTLSQHGGKYYVKHLYEKASDYYTYNWALAFQSKAASADSVTIDTMKFRRDAEQSFLSPIKEIGIKLLNRNIGGSLVADINDYNELTGPWDYSNYNSAYFTIGGQIQLTAAGAAAPYPASNGYITLTSGVNVERVTLGDYLKVRFSLQSPGTEITSEWPQYRIVVVKDGVETVGPWTVIPNGWSLYESPLSSQFQLAGAIGASPVYNIKIEIASNEAVTDYETYFKDFDISRETIVEGEVIGDITFDRFFKAQSNKGKRRTDTVDMYFADTSTLTDFAALAYSSVITSSWARYGKAETISLLQSWARDYLLNRQQYTDYLMLQVKDTGDAITPVKWIIFGGKNYQIVSYEKSYRTSWVSLHLKQILADDITLTWGEWPLTTVDGAGGGSTPYTPAVMGPQGLQGATGAQGPQGHQGHQGHQGGEGERGDIGPQGVQGAKGDKGDKGENGFQGDQGYQGAQGHQGNQGNQGHQGYQGVEGGPGPTGVQGPQGFKGDKGENGFQGDQGYQGTQGNQGNQGNQGHQGYQGVEGGPGLTGVQGPQGYQGTKGDNGFQGDQGYQGNQGHQGNQGVQGHQGTQGDVGDRGPTGPQGNQGFKGDKGDNGFQGDQGYQGNQGNQGAQGATGSISVSSGTADPSGGSDGDIYFQYT